MAESWRSHLRLTDVCFPDSQIPYNRAMTKSLLNLLLNRFLSQAPLLSLSLSLSMSLSFSLEFVCLSSILWMSEVFP
jgi:hypothetical protein